MDRILKNVVQSIKYYAVGEYGTKSMRPHYHIILFNAKLELIDKAWQLGATHYGTLTEASVGYTLKYISKPAKVPMHKNDDRLREFSIMSKGLGENYMSEKMVQWHLSSLHDRMYCTIEDGKKISMPRYYKDKIYSEQQRKAVGAVTRMKMHQQLNQALEIDPEYFTKKLSNDAGLIQQFAYKQKNSKHKI